MFDWIDETTRAIGKKTPESWLDLAHHGATAKELNRLEKLIGVPLPPSYRQFLLRWDGSNARLVKRQEFFFSVELVIKWATSVAPFTGGAEDDYYAEKSPGLLAIYRTPHGSDVECLDLRAATARIDGEPAVLTYDAEEPEPKVPKDPRRSESGYQPNFASLVADHIVRRLSQFDDDRREAGYAALRAAAKRELISSYLLGD